MMTEMKNWLSSIRESEEIMDRIDPIPTAMLPAPRIEPPPPDEEAEALAHAAKLVEGFKTQRAQLETMLAEATRALKDRNREVELLGLDLAQAKNDLQRWPLIWKPGGRRLAICGPFLPRCARRWIISKYRCQCASGQETAKTAKLKRQMRHSQLRRIEMYKKRKNKRSH